jgi:hypothetical protein
MPGHLNQVQIQDLPPAQQLKSSTKIKLIAGTKFTTDCTTMDQLLAKGVAGAALTLLVAAEIEEDMGRNQKERQDDGGGAEMTTVEYVTICVPTRGGGSNVGQTHTLVETVRWKTKDCGFIAGDSTVFREHGKRRQRSINKVPSGSPSGLSIHPSVHRQQWE